jgi:hypothetical protein
MRSSRHLTIRERIRRLGWLAVWLVARYCTREWLSA